MLQQNNHVWGAGLSTRRKRAAWKNAASKTTALATLQHKDANDECSKQEEKRKEKAKQYRRSRSASGRIQGHKKNVHLCRQNSIRDTEDLTVTLRQEKKTKMDRIINEMYAADFEEDFGILLLLLKQLRVKDDAVAEYKNILLRAEVEGIEETFAQGFDVLVRSEKVPPSGFNKKPGHKKCSCLMRSDGSKTETKSENL